MAKSDNKRRYSGSGPRPDLNDVKQKEAIERQLEWAKLSPQHQLDALDRRLGRNVGAVKQRRCLTILIERQKCEASVVAPKPAKRGER